MMACAAILGCTSAVNIETESTLEATPGQWTLPNHLASYINLFDSRNEIGFRGTLIKCARTNGKGKVCKTLQNDVKWHKRLEDIKSRIQRSEPRLASMIEDEYQGELEMPYSKFSGDQHLAPVDPWGT